MVDAAELTDTLRRDGFVVFRDFFPPETVEQAHRELEGWYRKDLADRAAKGVTLPPFEGAAGASQLTAPSHLLLDVYGKSPAFDGLFEKVLTDPLSSAVLRAFAGQRFKMRGYNIRRMTGAYDPPPAHEWHRDSPGEFCIGIFLTDVQPEEHAATALVPGSHRFPIDPRWDCLLSQPYRSGMKVFLRLNRFNRKLARTALKGATGAYGKRGDFYIFMNDVWHGRQPNLHGSQTMVALLGAFPTEFPYPDSVKMPPAEVLNRLPPAIQAVVRQDQPPNSDTDTIIHEVLRNRRAPEYPDPFYLARLERRSADLLSAPVLFTDRMVRKGYLAARLTAKWTYYWSYNNGRAAVRWIYRRTLKRTRAADAGHRSA